MLAVNTISYNGQTAVINSYTIGFINTHKALYDAMHEQIDLFRARYPKAIVKTEILSHIETVKLVATQKEGNTSHNVGRISEGLEALPVR